MRALYGVLRPRDLGGRVRSFVLQVSSFGAVGLVAGVFDYSAMVALRELFGVGSVSAAACGYILGSIISYLLNRRLTFRSGRPHGEAVWRFVFINIIGFALTTLLMGLLVHQLAINYMLARLVTIALVFNVNFISHKFWTFRLR